MLPKPCKPDSGVSLWIDSIRVKSMVSVDLYPMLNTVVVMARVSSSPSESKYLVTSSPSEAVSASIPLIHSIDHAYGLGKGGGGGGEGRGTIEAGLTSVILLHDIVAMYVCSKYPVLCTNLCQVTK